jgi:hypothetical protein
VCVGISSSIYSTVSSTPEILADKKTSAWNPRYLRSATIRPKDHKKARHVETLTYSYL